MITAMEIADWRENATTVKILDYFKKLRENYKESLAEGIYSNPSVDAMAIKHSNVIGMCQAYKDILDISYEDFEAAYDIQPKEEEK